MSAEHVRLAEEWGARQGVREGVDEREQRIRLWLKRQVELGVPRATAVAKLGAAIAGVQPGRRWYTRELLAAIGDVPRSVPRGRTCTECGVIGEVYSDRAGTWCGACGVDLQVSEVRVPSRSQVGEPLSARHRQFLRAKIHGEHEAAREMRPTREQAEREGGSVDGLE